MSYLVPKPIFVVKSPLINFKSTGNTIIYTTKANESLMLIGYSGLVVTATAAAGDPQFNFGWTAASYNNWTPSAPQASFNTVANSFFYVPYQESGNPIMLPPSTSLRINVTSADSGTALTGYIYLHLFIS